MGDRRMKDQDLVCKSCLGSSQPTEIFAPCVYVSADGDEYDVFANADCDLCHSNDTICVSVPPRGDELYERAGGGVLAVCIACDDCVVELRGGRFVACTNCGEEGAS
jgi:hypothetical protein